MTIYLALSFKPEFTPDLWSYDHAQPHMEPISFEVVG